MESNLPELQLYIDLGLQILTTYSLKIFAALLIFFIGKRVAHWISDSLVALLKRNDVDVELVGFFGSLSYWALFIAVCVAALSQLGVQTASLVAVLGAMGLAIGLALQGSLSNFAAGVLIILLRPFRVGDWVDIAGESGRVEHIKIFTTELRTGDNKCVIIPNARVLDGNITNHSSTGIRRVDLLFSISYQDDIDVARTVISELLKDDDRILVDPEPTIRVAQLAASSVDLSVKPWVKTQDYWDVSYDLYERTKKAFDAKGISIPFPQSEIRIVQTQQGD